MEELYETVVASVISLARIRSRKLSEIGAKFRCLRRKSGSPSKNVTSDFASEVAKYAKSGPKPQNGVRALSRPVSDAACMKLFHVVPLQRTVVRVWGCTAVLYLTAPSQPARLTIAPVSDLPTAGLPATAAFSFH